MTRRLYRAAVFLLVCYWLTIFTATHLPPSNLPRVEVSDKIEHFAAFLLLSLLLHAVLQERSRAAAWLILLLAMAYGAIDEWLQPLVGRGCELADWFADVAGAASGVCLMGLFNALRTRLFRRPADASPAAVAQSIASAREASAR